VCVLGEDISGGKVVIRVLYVGIPVHTETHDLCDETACPVAPGSFVLSHSQTLPSITPPVRFLNPYYLQIYILLEWLLWSNNTSL